MIRGLLLSEGVAKVVAPPFVTPPEGALLWVDCDRDDTRSWIEPVEALTGTRVFENHLSDLENLTHRSFFDSTQDYEMIVFRGLAGRSTTEQASSVIRVRTRPSVFFMFPRCLVTIRAIDSHVVPAIHERMMSAGQRLPTRPEELMLRILSAMVDRYLDLREPLSEQLERWQRELLDPRRPFNDWLTLLDGRREARRLEQLCEEQLASIQEWLDERLERRPEPGAAGFAPLNDALEVRANDLIEHIERILVHARRLESSVESAVQLHFASTAHRTNEVVRTLTTITAIFLPLTLITGIFGMNFEAIPGQHSPFGFWITMAAMAVIAVALLGFFRARRYLSEKPRRPRPRKN